MESLSDTSEDVRRRMSTPSDNDGKVGSGQTRRRIAVAVKLALKNLIHGERLNSLNSARGVANARSSAVGILGMVKAAPTVEMQAHHRQRVHFSG